MAISGSRIAIHFLDKSAPPNKPIAAIGEKLFMGKNLVIAAKAMIKKIAPVRRFIFSMFSYYNEYTALLNREDSEMAIYKGQRHVLN